MKNEDYAIFIRGKIVAICEAILKEELGVIAGSRILCGLEHELAGSEAGNWPQRDEDFITFVAINSETDHLPVDYERANWSAEALQSKDGELAKAAALYKEDAFAACRKLIERCELKDVST